MSRTALLSATLLATALTAAEPAKAGAGDVPTAEEVEALQMLNYHRLERRRGDNRITVAIKRKQVTANMTAWNHSASGTAKQPPLVFNPALTAAARAVLKSGPKPVEKTPNDFAGAMKAAGYAPDKDGLTLIAMEAPSLSIAYAAAIAFPVGETTHNKTQLWPVFARGEALKGEFREAGVAVATAGGKTSLVMVLGLGSAKRHLGGLVFADANHNGTYDPGEGRAGVTVSAGGATMTTGPGGAWWLALDKDDAVDVTFDGQGAKAVRPAPKGAANIQIDWRLPLPADLKIADKLLADADRVAKEPDLEKKRKPLAALIAGTRGLCLDDERQKKVDDLTQPVRIEFEELVKNTLSALSEDQSAWKKRSSELQKPWKGGLSDWFKSADALYKLRQQVNAVQAAPAEQQPRQAAGLQKPLAKAIAETTDPAFMDQLLLWKDDMDELAATEEDKKAAEKKKAK